MQYRSHDGACSKRRQLPLRTRSTGYFDGGYSKEQFDKVLDASAILRRAEVLDGLAVDTGSIFKNQHTDFPRVKFTIKSVYQKN